MSKWGARAYLHLRIHGRVQGVWFRGWTVREAKRLDLDGWVRNLSDGSVEILARGTNKDLDDFCKACWSGPPTACVEKVETQSFHEGKSTDSITEDGFHELANYYVEG